MSVAQAPLFRGLASAVFSECSQHPMSCYESCPWRLYRYLLKWPTGVDSDRICLFALANPSTASAERTDNTVAKCIKYAGTWGFGWCWVVNARAWRATDPKNVPLDPLAIGDENDNYVKLAAKRAEFVVAGWGKLGTTRGPVMLELIRRSGKVPHALHLTKAGEPGHPLYLRNDAKPFPIPEAP